MVCIVTNTNVTLIMCNIITIRTFNNVDDDGDDYDDCDEDDTGFDDDGVTRLKHVMI